MNDNMNNNNINTYDIDENTLMIETNSLNYFDLQDKYDLLSKELTDCNKSMKKKEETINNLRIMNYNLQEKYDSLYDNSENCKVFNVEEINKLSFHFY